MRVSQCETNEKHVDHHYEVAFPIKGHTDQFEDCRRYSTGQG